jgi:hypothetical protein
MGKRVVAGTAAVLLTCGVSAGCHAGGPEGQATATSAAAAKTARAQEAAAINALHAWMALPLLGTLSISTIEMGKDGTATSRYLSGLQNTADGTADLSGYRTVQTKASTTQKPIQAVEDDGKLYESVPPAKPDSSADPKWLVSDTSSVQPSGSMHSLWWLALGMLDKVHADGPSEVDGRSAVEYTGTVDLADITGASKFLSSWDLFHRAGTKDMTVDLYTDLGTGALVRLTYRLGLPVSVDATPTASSTAGYEVDLSGFATTTPSPSGSATTLTGTLTPEGDSELCQLMLF